MRLVLSPLFILHRRNGRGIRACPVRDTGVRVVLNASPTPFQTFELQASAECRCEEAQRPLAEGTTRQSGRGASSPSFSLSLACHSKERSFPEGMAEGEYEGGAKISGWCWGNSPSVSAQVSPGRRTLTHRPASIPVDNRGTPLWGTPCSWPDTRT